MKEAKSNIELCFVSSCTLVNSITSKTDKISHVAENMVAQMKVVEDSADTLISAVTVWGNKLSTEKGAASSKLRETAGIMVGGTSFT